MEVYIYIYGSLGNAIKELRPNEKNKVVYNFVAA